MSEINADPHPLGDMPNPTSEQLDSPAFHALWNAIKSWDVNVPEYYEGYCGANGSHVALLLEALDKVAPRIDVLPPLRPGDVLLVRLGIADLGDGMGSWVPTQGQLEETRDQFKSAVPDGVHVIVYHFGIDTQLIPVRDERFNPRDAVADDA